MTALTLLDSLSEESSELTVVTFISDLPEELSGQLLGLVVALAVLPAATGSGCPKVSARSTPETLCTRFPPGGFPEGSQGCLMDLLVEAVVLPGISWRDPLAMGGGHPLVLAEAALEALCSQGYG